MTMVFLDSTSTSPWTVPASFSYQPDTFCADTSAQANAFYFNFGDGSARWRTGQTFVATATVDVDLVTVRMSTSGTGNPQDALYCTLFSDGSFTSVLGVSNPVNPNDVSNYGLGQYCDFMFNKPITLTSGNTYAFSIHRAGTTDGTNFFRLLGDQINFYTSGAQMSYDGSSWSASGSGWDTSFKVGQRGHTVELAGCGGFGAVGTNGTAGNGGGGGAGGRYVKLTWASGTYGATVPFLVGSGGSGNHTQWQSSVANTGNFQQGTAGGNASGVTGGAAGSATVVVGSPTVTFTTTTNNAGGTGGSSGATRGGGGGAGGGGPHGAGANGGSPSASGAGGGGGGGADGGTAGASPSTATFGIGGNGWNGTGGSTNGATGSGDGGGAGSTTVTTTPVAAGTPGSSGGYYWSDNLVFGNGGGGGGCGGSTTNVAANITAGSAGSYNAGGGGCGYARGTGTYSAGGAGRGLIEINYIARSGANNSGPPQTFSTTTTAIDAGTNPKDTAGFNVQTGDIIVAYAMAESGHDGTNNVVIDVSSAPTSTTAVITWTQQQDTAVRNINNPYLRVFTGQVTTGGFLAGVRFNRSSGTGIRFLGFAHWFRFTDGVGTSTRADNGTGAASPTISLTPTQVNSALTFATVDKNAVSGAVSPSASRGIYVQQDLAEQSGAGVSSCEYISHLIDTLSIANTTMSMSSPTGQRYISVLLEIKGNANAPAAGPKAPPPFSRPRKLSYNRRIS